MTLLEGRGGCIAFGKKKAPGFSVIRVTQFSRGNGTNYNRGSRLLVRPSVINTHANTFRALLFSFLSFPPSPFIFWCENLLTALLSGPLKGIGNPSPRGAGCSSNTFSFYVLLFILSILSAIN